MITVYVCSVSLVLKPIGKKRVFSGFISRSLFSRALSSVYPELFDEVHERRKPSTIYVSPMKDEASGRIIEHVKEEGVYAFDMYSISVDVAPIGKELLEVGEYLLKDYNAEILRITGFKTNIKPMRVTEENIVAVNFVSPTSFRMTPLRRYHKKASYFPFPRPDLFIKSIIRTLKESDVEGYESITANWTPKDMRLIDFKNARTKVYYDFRGRPYLAFKGKFFYEISKPKPYGVLLSLANITGVGAWRASGFGRVDIRVLGDNSI